MAKVSLYLDLRRSDRNGCSSLKLAISHSYQFRYISIGVNLHPDQWDRDRFIVKNTHPQYQSLNMLVSKYKSIADIALLELEISGRLSDMTISEIVDVILDRLGSPKRKQRADHRFFLPCYMEFMQTKKGKTLECYEFTLSKLTSLFPELPKLRMDDIKTAWLIKLENLLSEASCKNTIAIHMVNIRAVFNYALDNEYTINYPFRRYKIRREKTEKRSLEIEQLRELFAADVEDWQRPYLDYFKLTFFLIGINAVDLLGAKRTSICNGRLKYRRSKTSGLFSVKLEPEAMELIEKYSGEEHLIKAMESYSKYDDYLHRINKGLQSIGPMRREGRGGKKIRTPLFPKLTTYWARHTWSTIAADLDIPDATISLALGHAGENRTTDIYIRRNLKKVDEANRKVIDWVLYGKR